jgi:mono/diheme cytochrome c family protein
MESNHEVAKGFWLTFGGGSLIALLIIAAFVYSDSTNPPSGGSPVSAPPAATSTASTEMTDTSTEMTDTSAASTETTAASTAATTGGSAASNAAGKQVFQASCGGCHTLANADTGGQVGPNLDDLKPSAAIVQHQVENGGGGMPSFSSQLSAKQIQAVATYVAAVAGKGGGSGLPTGGAP